MAVKAKGTSMTRRLKDAKDITRHLEGERNNTEDIDFKKISEALLPQRGFFPVEGDSKSSIMERGKKNINPAATLSLERAAGGLTTGMTPEGQPWFGLRMRDTALMDEPGVREHLGLREQLINTVLRKGGFYQSAHECNLELLGFGGLLLFADTSDSTVARFEACTAGTYCVAHNTEGVLDTVVRRLRWSVKHIERKFGREKMSKKSVELLEGNPYTKVDVVHVVSPRETRDDTKIDNLNMPFQSIMFEDFADEDSSAAVDVLSEKGYHEMPYFYAPYARVGDSDYGMGPGHLLVGHSGQLNETERQKVIALQKMFNPPMKKPSGMKNRLNIGAGHENAVSANDAKGLEPLYEVPVQGYQWCLQEIKDIMERIASVTKADLFMTMPLELRPANVTATEFMEQKREKLQQVAPVISLYEPRVLDAVITRVNNMLDRMGLFPPPPPALAEAGEFEIEYVSSVAKSLRQAGAEATRALMADVGALAQMQLQAQQRPTAIMKVDVNQAVDELANGLGAPASVVLDDATFEEKLKAEEAKEAQMQQQQQANDQADQLSKVGGVSTQGTLAGELLQEGQA